MIKFYTFPLSLNARRVHFGLEEMGLPYEAIQVNLLSGENKKPEYLEIHPNGKIPAIIDGDFTLYESNAILFYLAEKSGRLLPKSPEDRARVMQWMFYLTAHVGPAFSRPWFNLVVLPEGKRDMAAVKLGQEEAARYLAVLEQTLKKREYLVGEFSIADISNATAVNLHEGGQIDIKPFPHVASWLEKIRARPGWKGSETQL